MTIPDNRTGRRNPGPGGAPALTPPTGAAVWARDLSMGIRFAAGGGREGWTRTLLTAVGVALGVMLLLVAASVPHLTNSRAERSEARYLAPTSHDLKPSPETMLAAGAGTEFRGDPVGGKLLRPDGARPPLPPGVAALPGYGEMVVSPALQKLLESPDGKLLRERLPGKITGTIAQAGLRGPGDLYYYAGSDTLRVSDPGVQRIEGFGDHRIPATMPPILLAIVILACVVLLMPVAIFIATAVRFGSESRDRRLAALRLVGADIRMTHRMAAGEALFGSLFGLVLGAVLYFVARQAAASVTVWDVNVFASDITPSPALAALVVVAVPLSAVGVTLLALRSVTIEPLGVVRHSTARRRRVWWRVPLPIAGVLVLLLNGKIMGGRGTVNPVLLAGGAALVLVGITVLLPWLVEAVVGRLRGGPVPWQLATRRLQLNSGSASRAVSGITVAVAGAIALQLAFAAIQGDYTKETGQDTERAQMSVALPSRDIATTRKMIEDFRATTGVLGVIAATETSVVRPGPPPNGEESVPNANLTVGDCPSLREMAQLPSCKDGDVFIVRDGTDDSYLKQTARPGAKVLLNYDYSIQKPSGPARLWTIPKSARDVAARKNAMGRETTGIFATPSSIDMAQLTEPVAQAFLRIDPAVPDGIEHVRNTAARVDPLMQVVTLRTTERDKTFASVQTGLLVASTATLVLIAASLLVATLEQLRERRRLLSVLVAFGTRRATLGWSVLWQTAVPVFLGLALAVAGGCGLGFALLKLIGKSAMDWSAVWPLPAAGAALVLLVTLLSLPPLWRLMRPDGLRTE
ncbi:MULTISPECIES: FtsX-like permease family protein [Streptomyces]|uniref:FtsX-like permease family protein n=1 Tax=Streptomyces TaxID=1883 RepID=UPI000699F406|nr:FtsX-like permease family protein [Streptomyces sp. SID7805]MYU55042.1 ABC transporter permease [Streptomyces sp. SID7805]